MQIIIGVNPDSSDEDAFALGSVLARMLAATPVLAHVYPTAFEFPSPASVDAEWMAFVRERSAEILGRAKERFCRHQGWAADEVRTSMTGNRSSGRGLAELAQEPGTAMVVIGSAPGGSPGQFTIGSTADKLLHKSPAAVALAPAGYASDDVKRIGRIVVEFQNTAESNITLTRAAGWAQRFGVPLTVLTILLRHRMYGSALGADVEGEVLSSIAEDATVALDAALNELNPAIEVRHAIVRGESVVSAIAATEWHPNDVLVLSSTTGGQLQRVFLGDMTYRLVRVAPVPCVVLPRRA